MASPTRFVPNPAFEPALLADPTITGEVIIEATNAVAQAAKRYVPKRLRNLEQSIKPIVGLVGTVIVGRVVATDFKAHWWEFGYRTHPAGSPYLRPALAEVLPGAPIVGGLST